MHLVEIVPFTKASHEEKLSTNFLYSIFLVREIAALEGRILLVCLCCHMARSVKLGSAYAAI